MKPKHCCSYSARTMQKHWMHSVEALCAHWRFYYKEIISNNDSNATHNFVKALAVNCKRCIGCK